MARRFSPDYTAADVMQLYRLRIADGDEGRLRSIAAAIRALCRLEVEPKIPKQYKGIAKDVRTPFVRDAWQRITSSLVAKPPVEHVTPKDEKKGEYREAANLCERFDAAMLERFNKETGKDIVYNLTAQQVRDGESVLKVAHRKEAWANFPKRASDEDADAYRDKVDEYKRGADLPIAWTDVDRFSIVYEGGDYGDQWVIEYGEYAKPYLKVRYGMREDDDGRLITPGRTLEGRGYPEGLNPSSTGHSVKVEFFTDREWHVLIDNSEAPGYPKANPYAPYLPYFRARCSDGESLLYSLLFLVPRMDELLTMKLVWSYLGSYATPVLESVPNSSMVPSGLGAWGDAGEASGAKGPKALTWEPGKLMDLPLGRTMRFLEVPPIGKDLNDLVVIFKNLIDVAGIPSVMRGMAGTGDSGYLANQMMQAAQMAYKLAAVSSQRQLEKAVEFSHWLIANVVKQTVYVLGWDNLNPKTGRPKEKAEQAWLGLSPDSSSKNVAPINRLGPVSFQYRPTLPTDEQARAMIALQLTNAEKPLYDVRHALETWMQEEDPENIIDAIYVEQALNEEPLKSMVVENALREAGLLPPQATPSPAAGLVDQFGNPLVGNVIPPGMQGVPLANQAPPGMPGVPGLTMPLQPPPPQPGGIPGNVGGREAGMYPGMPPQR